MHRDVRNLPPAGPNCWCLKGTVHILEYEIDKSSSTGNVHVFEHEIDKLCLKKKC